MKIKVSEATIPQLNWMVASIADKHVTTGDIVWGNYSPSTDWAQGGPIIKRECITLRSPTNQLTMFWVASIGQDQHRRFNHDPLIAAMQCYVASKLGNEVEVPDEIV